MGSFFDSTQVQVGTRILGLILFIWWTGVGSLQLCWLRTNLHTKHRSYNTYTFIYKIYMYCTIMNSKGIAKKVNKMLGILRMINNISLFLEFFDTLGLFSIGICYKVQISSKVTDLDSYFRLLRLVKFESIWIQVYPVMFVSGSLTVFSLFSLILNSKEVFQEIFLLWFSIAEWFSLLAPSLFIVPS